MLTEIKRLDGYYCLHVDGRRMIERESFEVVNRIKERLDNPELDDFSEATEVARSIRDYLNQKDIPYV